MAYNKLGLRDVDYAPKAKKGWTRILLLGSSTLAGPGISSDETSPKQLEAILRKKKKNVEVINGGIEGYFALHFAAVAKNLVQAYSPTHVVLLLQLGIGANVDVFNELYSQWSDSDGVQLRSEVFPIGLRLASWNGWPIEQWEYLRKIYTFQSAGHRLLRTLSCGLKYLDSAKRTLCLMDSSIRAVQKIRQLSEAGGAKFLFLTPDRPVRNIPILGAGHDLPIARKFDQITPTLTMYPSAAIEALETAGVKVERIEIPSGEGATLPNDYHLNAIGSRKLAELLAPAIEKWY